MWEWRGDLPVEVASANDLIVGEAGFIDGWIVVIGPARNYTGAPFRIRYQAAEPFLGSVVKPSCTPPLMHIIS